MQHSLFASLLGAALAFCPLATAVAKEETPLSAVQIDTLALQTVETRSEFTVIDSRMDETGTAVVLFGLIGGAVNSSINKSEDDKKAAPLVPTAAAIDVDGLIVSAMQAKLATRPDVVKLADPPANATNTLVVDIGEWGLVRKAQGTDKTMRTFLKLNISILDARGKPVWGPQREHAIGQMSGEMSAFTPEVFKVEMETLATRTGQQVANKLIYR